ncbi:phosphatidate cytidylyltransferase [Croceicoccus sp. BE223]|uniref:phosphatidate cytidylyltransferase n=1 Tax=Croceicoccus sp. BE223 TaxID=2817716 RepID=UPI002860E1C6|nr:phosphatidate cytidylyltransferase [Croceicoccus sp. BE223]MDR7101272.1 phosphatidate cytidylyltransferase [Croceicoccus sp. BE223]
MADAELSGPVEPGHVRPEGPRRTDLGVRVVSAIVMVAVAALCLWLGGWLLDLLIVLVAGTAYFEWQRIVRRMAAESGMGGGKVLAWMLAGALYMGVAAWLMVRMDSQLVVFAILVTAFIDTFAYFAGRTIGGPKIAPAISPSKTWAGLGGGVVGAALALVLFMVLSHAWTLGMRDGQTSAADTWFVVMGGPTLIVSALAAGAVLAVLAQAGDFFESWMKRRAKLKDSSQLIPGHGGVFDRIDGLLPVSILIGLLALVAQ